MGISNLKELFLILVIIKVFLVFISFFLQNKSKVSFFFNLLYPIFFGFQINTRETWSLDGSLFINEDGIGLLTLASGMTLLLMSFNWGKGRELNNIFYIFLLFISLFVIGSLDWIHLFFSISILFICFSFLYLVGAQKDGREIKSRFFLSNSFYILFLFIGILFLLVSTGDLSFGPLEIAHYNLFPVSLIFIFIFFCGLMGVFPFHSWLVGSIKEFKESDLLAYLFYSRLVLGFLFFKKLFLFIGELNDPDFKNFIFLIKILSALTCIYGSLISIRKCSLKEKLAFHPTIYSGIVLIFLFFPKLELRNELFLFLILCHTFSLSGTLNFLSRNERKTGFSAFYFIILLFSLIGVPLTGGFTSNFLAFFNFFTEGYFYQGLILLLSLTIFVGFNWGTILKEIIEQFRGNLSNKSESKHHLEQSWGIPQKIVQLILALFVIIGGVGPSLYFNF